MRDSTIFVLAAALVCSAPAWASGAPAAQNDADIEVVPSVNLGDQIGIACYALDSTDADSDVRVVLTISAEPDQAPPGYGKVLATDAQIAQGAVHVRIPNLPDLENHTVNVDVYVLGDKGEQSCNAGHIRVVRSPSASQSRPLG